MKKKNLLLLLVVLALATPLFAQQITRIAVIDISRVYTTFFRDAQNVRDYERKKAEYQGNIKRMTDEVQKLESQRLEAERQGNDVKVLKLEGQISSKSAYLVEYANVKNNELAQLKKKLMSDDGFYKSLYKEISNIAEREGFSMVMNLQNSESVIWYSQSVDITDKVISQLNRSRNQ